MKERTPTIHAEEEFDTVVLTLQDMTSKVCHDERHSHRNKVQGPICLPVCPSAQQLKLVSYIF